MSHDSIPLYDAVLDLEEAAEMWCDARARGVVPERIDRKLNEAIDRVIELEARCDSSS